VGQKMLRYHLFGPPLVGWLLAAACHVIQCIMKARFVSWMASYDVARYMLARL